MIYVNIRGRLGNQMFMYALARKIQLETNQKITFNYVNYKSYYNLDKIEKPDLNYFDINNNEIYFEATKKLPFYADGNFAINKIFRKLSPNQFYEIYAKKNIFIWLGRGYKPLVYNKDKDIYLDGYWQSAKYFDKYKLHIQKELIPKIDLSKKSEEMLKFIEETNSICVSIRRGDYVTVEKNKKKYYICNKMYFEKAIKKMYELLPKTTWFVFSDDIEWAKKNLNFPTQVHFQPTPITPFETMFLMSKCKHFIISNSSFSWWGQYLSTNKGKIVIAPNRWYAIGDSGDIIEDSWVKIEI